MLSPCFAKMDTATFSKLPTSTNAVESFNRVSKEDKPDVLKVAMMHTYKLDMAAALEGMALQKKVPTAYEDMSPAGREKRAKAQSRARIKRFRGSNDSNDCPPDKKRDLRKGTVVVS